MNLVRRLKNLWALSSAVEDEKDTVYYDHFPKENELPQVELKEVFIPRVTRDPVKEITNEH